MIQQWLRNNWTSFYREQLEISRKKLDALTEALVSLLTRTAAFVASFLAARWTPTWTSRLLSTVVLTHSSASLLPLVCCSNCFEKIITPRLFGWDYLCVVSWRWRIDRAGILKSYGIGERSTKVGAEESWFCIQLYSCRTVWSCTGYLIFVGLGFMLM